MDVRRYVLVESLVAAAINGLLSLVFVFLVFRSMPHVPLWGTPGLVLDALPQSFMVALMSMFVPTLVLRGRMRRGLLANVHPRRTRLPKSAFGRALLVAVAVACAAFALHALLLPLAGRDRWPFATIAVAKVAYGALLGLLVTRFALAMEMDVSRG